MENFLLPCQGKSIHSALEKQLIRSYLRKEGYQLEGIKGRPPLISRELLVKASQYASLKLAEIESRSKFINKIHFET